MNWLVGLTAMGSAMAPAAASAGEVPEMPAEAPIEIQGDHEAPHEPEARLALLMPERSSYRAMPAAEELQRRGARIGRIEIEVEDIFEASSSLAGPGSLGRSLGAGSSEYGPSLASPYRLANGLHISTRDETVAQQLLFHTGERYDIRVIEETERLLRGQRYLNEASIEPTGYNADNTVDLRVRVHDVWTLSPGFSFGRKGGENSTRLKFQDTNFLGLGKQIALERSSNVDRSAWRLSYTDPNLFGSWWKLSGAYSSFSDGSENAFSLERPFYALDSRWSANIAAMDTVSAVPRYSLGHRVESLDMQLQQFELGGGFSAGLRDGWARRYLGGVRYESRRFSARPREANREPNREPNATIPDDRVIAYPWIGLEVLQDQYVSTHNLDQIGRTEDLYLGRSARLEAGWASTALGSTHSALILAGQLQAGAEFDAQQYLINALAIQGRIEGGGIANGRLEASSRYYRRHSDKRVFFASATTSVASHLDPEEQLLLGGDNGLRGYPLRYQAGTASALVTLEERFYTNWQPLKLFNVGAAVFFDAGRTWGRDEFAAAPIGWLKDVGVGLRLGSVRSGLGNVLHIDFAFPLDGGKDIDSVQFLVETQKSF